MPFAIALAVSALLHAAAIVAPGWDLPGLGEPEPAPLEARLTPPPAPSLPQAPKPAKPKPRPKPTAVAHAASAAAVPPVPAMAEEAPAVPTAEPPPPPPPVPVVAPAAEPAPAPAPLSPPWPRQGRVRYVVTYGENAFVIGETVHEWRVDGERYWIRTAAQPKGLAAVFGKTRRQESSGSVSADGLRPEQFRDSREGRAEESAGFDWQRAQAFFSNGSSAGPLAPGMQDLVSVFYQLAWLMPRADLELAVATASRLGRWRFEWLGEEELALAAGKLATLHLRTRADGDTTEIWLAPGQGGLPVKIRHVDRKGDVFEQVADVLELN